MKRRIISSLLCLSIAASLVGCSTDAVMYDKYSKDERMSKEDARLELDTMLSKVETYSTEDPILDIYMDEEGDKLSLADISTFDVTVDGQGEIDIEIATVSEFAGEAPDDWINIVARNFNNENFEIDGKSVTVTIRNMSAGEVVTYVAADAYKPNVYIPSNNAWGKMLEASGVDIKEIEDKIAGNTAGILMSNDVYKTFIDKYKDATLSNVIKAANAGDIIFAYTNPYTSSTGLNMLTAMLKDFDSNDPLSDKASSALLEYQKNSPPVAYTTGVLRNQAKKGIIDAMVMEEQAYINTPELRNYEFIPFGIRHDHPVYTFGWNTDEENNAAQMFVDFCLTEENQKLATEKGFNKNNTYKSQDSGLTGTGYLTAQSIWKQNKNGGRPIVAVFVADVSGSMGGEPLHALQNSLISTLPYIGDEHYVGLVTYSDSVTVNLPIDVFNNRHRALFSGEVKNLIANGGTATYNGVLVGLDLLEKKMQEIPDATPLMFVLTDGATTHGFTLDRVAPIVAGMSVPVYTIAYNYGSSGDLEELSGINEAATINADSSDIVNQLRNLFNTQL